MAEHKTRSPQTGAGSSERRDQQQRDDGRGEAGGSNPRNDDEHSRGRSGSGGRDKGGSRGGSE